MLNIRDRFGALARRLPAAIGNGRAERVARASGVGGGTGAQGVASGMASGVASGLGYGLAPGGGAGRWTPVEYGEYYPRSAMVYAAIKARQDAVARLPLRVLRRSGDAARLRAGGEPAGADHPLQRLLDAPNPFWTRGDLWRATETHLALWGAAFWALERGEDGGVAEIWPLRPDKVRIVPDDERYVRGFVYVGEGGRLAPYIPEDIVWMRYFNPLDDYAGLSPIAPLRLSADMGLDALRANRKLLQNDSAPGLIIETTSNPTDAEVGDFYRRWESRYQGVEKARRPALLGAGMRASNLGFSPRDMEYIQSLRWSLEDIARVFGVPKVMIGDFEHTTFSNFNTARRLFWEDTIAAQLALYEEALTQYLAPHFREPGLAVEFDLSGVEALKESEENKAKRRRMYVEAGIMSVDEVRREMNLPPVGG